MGSLQQNMAQQVYELQNELLERSKEVSVIQRKLLEGATGHHTHINNMIEGTIRDVLMIKDQIKRIDGYVEADHR